MEITQADRMKILEEIRDGLGIIERNDDEFTVKEIAKTFEIDAVNVVAFLDRTEIKYERRKAIANNRRQFVYKFLKDDIID